MYPRFVIIRSSVSGVHFGEQRADPVMQPNGLRLVTLFGSRRIHYWEGAGSCSGLAVYGPRSGRVAAPIDGAEIGDVCEILPCAAAAVEQIGKQPIWNG